LAAQIKRAKGVEVDLVKSSGGVFEVYRDGQLVFSKKSTGRFPHSDSEVIDALA
jgi:selT/selW/selH-like putative selenoprotein